MSEFEVIEEFLSIQGEGSLVGTPAYFVRLARCNLRCPWCDTKYSWSPGLKVPVSEVAERALESGVGLIVLTGGEPLLWQLEIRSFLKELEEKGFKGLVQIETNGTIYPSALEGHEIWITVSPKVTCDYYINFPSTVRRILENFSGELKLVVRRTDLTCVKKFLEELGDVPRPVVLQPLDEGEGYASAARELVLEVLKDDYLKRRVRVVPQVHKLLQMP
ncbi:7-carboxy-7-deazaguanine synthase QueE [Ignicoccus hospitalis]|uniref:7-carboxy-7-deazaguanine synthase n=1 Tax=Ignicoccus hospitalis (strain KIN4/I / DSM 18386 / JCM 14125) TaxID=453591 RepID=A8A911_IGNH4|nr:7-carboxy-7-deazaguanine synthase QueE [Ignicoccus hospitalis]ABU81413.1 Radical SAM domain protein [Ignicoccus hospitalis KIN4/I]HIH90280.1 7-carboxy-7-deazaguanine synthase QueE [Desulfurococcaceae archaeon]